ncbi:ubl carboxyl-terminal hydrolase 18 [Callorhinchus milii]|uniref:ubl carboxyl-terminal hydrolase 18 n=1 Tax=Callorhinchus milii TaxID=7868 RepID=UPI001C3FC11B|nr:ubl carboxyl-terminal hydrolase 18 [Callorhinchus milii]
MGIIATYKCRWWIEKETTEHSEDSSIVAGIAGSPEMQEGNEIKESQDIVSQKEKLVSSKNLTGCQVSQSSSEACDQTQRQSTVRRFRNVVGLNNMGCTCYFNALLQTLLLAPEFTCLLKRWDQMNLTSHGSSLPRELYRLFHQMETTEQTAVNPVKVLLCLFPNLRKANIQQDAGELFHTLFNLLLDQLHNPQISAEMKALYEIRVEQFVKCQVCGVVSEKQSRMISLPLQVPENHPHLNLEKSLKMFFQPQNLTQRNACFCWKCEKRTATLQGFKLFSLPSIVNFHLNRFCHRLDGFTRKINSTLEFDEILDLSKFPISEKVLSQRKSQSYWLYELFAVIVHMGSANFGHYIAYVKYFEDKKWYLIDDSSVHSVQWEAVKETFGSKRGQTAYLLLYRKAEQDAGANTH